MLRWRILLGVLLIAALAWLCWLDNMSGLPGTWLMPLALVLSILASAEMIRLSKSAGLKPIVVVVYFGNFFLVLSAWVPIIGQHFFSGQAADVVRSAMADPAWPMLVLAVFALLAFIGEMCRYDGGKGAIANLGATMLSLVYVGLMLAVLVELRLAYGVGALVSLVIVVKMGDVGAYAVGRLLGRSKMSPVLSPGKTLEGAVGAVVFSLLGAWFSFNLLVPWLAEAAGKSAASGGPTPWWGVALFGVAVGVAGMMADLAESLLKRDANCKDSSDWLPGFGGVLDILDSVLLAGPVAYFFCILGLVNCC